MYKYQRFAVDALNTFGHKSFKEAEAIRECKSEKWTRENISRARWNGLLAQDKKGYYVNSFAILLLCYKENYNIGDRFRPILAKMMLNSEAIEKINSYGGQWEIRDYRRFAEYVIFNNANWDPIFVDILNELEDEAKRI